VLYVVTKQKVRTQSLCYMVPECSCEGNGHAINRTRVPTLAHSTAEYKAQKLGLVMHHRLHDLYCLCAERTTRGRWAFSTLPTVL